MYCSRDGRCMRRVYVCVVVPLPCEKVVGEGLEGKERAVVSKEGTLFSRFRNKVEPLFGVRQRSQGPSL